MKEAVADVSVFVNVTHRLGETIGMDVSGDCQEGEVPVVPSIEQ